MVIRDLYRLGAVARPAETDTPLPVDANGILPATVAFQRFQPITRRREQIIQAGRCVHHIELAPCDGLDTPPARRTGAVAKQSLGGLVGKAADHGQVVCDTYRVTVKGKYPGLKGLGPRQV